MTDIYGLLGEESDSLLSHRCQGIPSESLYLPGPDFVDRVEIITGGTSSVYGSDAVAGVIKKCSEEGRKPTVADFGDKVEDAQFLNALQSGVNRWIREIQKVSGIYS